MLYCLARHMCRALFARFLLLRLAFSRKAKSMFSRKGRLAFGKMCSRMYDLAKFSILI